MELISKRGRHDGGGKLEDGPKETGERGERGREGGKVNTGSLHENKRERMSSTDKEKCAAGHEGTREKVLERKDGLPRGVNDEDAEDPFGVVAVERLCVGR